VTKEEMAVIEKMAHIAANEGFGPCDCGIKIECLFKYCDVEKCWPHGIKEMFGEVEE
jgi:hypothetical protein